MGLMNKMMRVAGRTKDGVARALRVNDEGKLEVDAQLTGSIVAHSEDNVPQGKNGDSLFLWDTRQVFLHDGTDWREV